MSADTLAEILIIVAAIEATLFLFLYPILSRSWWRTWIGRALFTSSLGLALLLDLSLLSQWLHLILPMWLVNLILAVVAAGTTLKLVALGVTKIQARRRSRDRV